MIKNNKASNTSINKRKLIYMPLLIGVCAIIIVSMSSYHISRRLLLDQMKQDGINLANLATRKINKEMQALEVINTLIEDKIRNAAREVLQNIEEVNNEVLKEVAENTGVDEIYLYNTFGEIVFSTIDAYLEWKVKKGHPVEKFMTSGKDELIEEIRKDTESDNYNKYGYFRQDDGTFMQVGVRACKIEELTQRFNYQSIVEGLASEENIEYALIVDTSLTAIADSDIDDIGVSYSDDTDYLRVMNGETRTSYWQYSKIDKEVLEVAVPLFYNDEIVGLLAIGLSMNNVYYHIYFMMLSSIIVALASALILFWYQNKNLIFPILALDENIRRIDVEKDISYRISSPKSDTFLGLSSSINAILNKVDEYFHQINEQKDYIEYTKYHDPLTNLPNKKMLIKKLSEEIENNRSGALILIDLDDLKEINDTLGHVYGDRVLLSIAEKLNSIVKKGVFVSRFGGDEFIVLISGAEDNLKIEYYVNKINTFLNNEIVIDNDEIHITCSMGISMYSPENNNNSVNQAIMNADMAMYAAKDLGKNNHIFFNDDMIKRLNEKVSIVNLLRKALKNREFKVLYQPQVCINTGEIIGFEALLRLKNSKISPAQFIPVAEKTGMIIEITRWVTEEVINQISDWQRKGFELKPIAINLSVKQLYDLNYLEFLENTLKTKGIEAKYIEIEITEGLLLEKEEKTLEFLNQIKEKGIKIALDDFGTGYSSLSYLTYLPVDKIKLDKSIIDRYLEDKNIKVVEGIVSLAHSLGLSVVAEGVENLEQLIKLKENKCNYIQGYIFSPPLDVWDVEKGYDKNYSDLMNI
jgi:diguanylate cyclase (GGDEF)-like protein